jgi:hypothetical protein
MPQSIADFESEQVFLNRAYSTGLIERFAKLSGLSAPLQIRIDTPTFNYQPPSIYVRFTILFEHFFKRRKG